MEFSITNTESHILGPVLSPNATFEESKAYCHNVLNLPGPIDQWLTANLCSPQIGFLKDYLIVSDMGRNYVVRFIEVVHMEVHHSHTVL
jgi:hypothetical protein